MSAIRIGLLAAEASDKENLYPHASELVVGAVAFAVIFFFMWKWVIPRVNTMLEERRTKIQGELERAEETRREADHILEEYRAQLTGAREEAGRIIEETRKTAEQLRKDMLGKAEEESQGIVARAQDEIRAERDRVFQELRSQIGEISVELAARIVGESLDEAAHQRLIDEYIDQVAGSGSGQA
ncbi:MAG: F-type H+-transporting ATPase subunit b [Chloroflexota bacterium]|jgi:F-type H+-transporting ATPase subunit b|nr:F-type H+-transporting ATPase subunit b [Chloroflexota bacterium]